MRISGFGYSVCSCVAVAMLAGCGSQSPIGAAGTVPQSDTIPAHTDLGRKASSGDLLYVAARGASYVLSYPEGKVVGTIATGALAACSDTSGNVFFVREGDVLEYAHGATTPSATLTIPDGATGSGCSVDPTSGNLAVAFGTTSVAIYPYAEGTPTTYSVADKAIFCGYDDNGNLFVDGYLGRGGGVSFSELPQGASSFSEVSVSPGISGGPWQVQWDGTYITVEADGVAGGAAVYRVNVSGSSGTIVGETKFKGFNGLAQQSWIAGSQILMPVGRRSIGPRTPQLGVWKYPAGGKPTATLKAVAGKSGDIYGVTISVAGS